MIVDIINTKSSTAPAVCGTDTLPSDGEPPCDTHSLVKNLGNEGLTDHSPQGPMTTGETSAQDIGSHRTSNFSNICSSFIGL